MVERRSNPRGWKQPKAPYNPYDAADQRPAEGYPSEYSAPGKPRTWSMIPKEPENYREVKESMRRLNYTPRPLSERYPGQFKILRRKGDRGFNAGVKLMGRFSVFTVIVVGVFFYRWNDGYDNVFSVPYRAQLRLRQRLFNNLSEQQLEDLESRQRGMSMKPSSAEDHASEPGVKQDGTSAFERPGRGHLLAAERLRQEREEAILRAVDIAERKLILNAPHAQSSHLPATGASESGEKSSDDNTKKQARWLWWPW